MIGIDRNTGRKIDGFDQLVSRITQVMTTPVGGRVKRPKFGSRVRDTLSANMSDSMLVRTQAAAIEAFYNLANGLHDFSPVSCVAVRHASGLHLYFEGHWEGRLVKFGVPLKNVSA
ncbi:phage baseplate protein [Pseudoalteromonas sp. Of7M-16]|uniref:phage baseplate protein n=1 Tax=Pseudoalteromonas sp. Of7M-16 TaxID=2917756 RepID=UPI001EF6E068|nr:phage baseplate protein [Pseudoalteromonas sp. Of7M-16]MCG7551571.1 phage baseplate protein [Pseudoalteromonas sp. Of7M-16]